MPINGTVPRAYGVSALRFLIRRVVTALPFALMLLLSVESATADSSSVSYPAVGFWNGFLDQLNVVECNNFGGSEVNARISLRDRAGAELAAQSIIVPALGTHHLVLNSLAGLADRYGTYRVELLNSSDGTRLRCLTAFYRFSKQAGRLVDYAFVLPVADPFTGEISGLFNSMDPETRGKVVQNWLTLYNPSAGSFSASLRLYGLDGSLQTERSLVLAPGERTDIALGHDDPQNAFQNVGLYTIVPSDPAAPYSAFLARYGSDGNRFRFGFTLLPSSGSCDRPSGFAATVNNAVNWAEIANVGSQALDVTLDAHDRNGTKKSTETFSLPIHGQQHIYLNQRIGDGDVGSFHLSCSSAGGKILVQSLYYGRAPDLRSVLWAYASQKRGSAGGYSTRLGVSVNTFLGMQNWLKVLDRAGRTTDVRSELFAANGTRVSEKVVRLRPKGTADLGLHESFAASTVGEGLLSFHETNADVFAETLRVFPDGRGGVESIMLVPTMALPESTVNVDFQLVADGLSSPVALAHAGDGSGRLFIAEREGRIRVLQNGAVLPTPFLDISSKVTTDGEMGLLGLAFHPQYSQNGRVFAVYSALDATTVLAEFRVSGDPNVVDPASESEVLSLPQPHIFHKGGQLAFGPDGYLYVSFGDGGFSGDPLGNGQNLGVLYGKILRLDVSSSPYRIPSDNPFVGQAGARGEIWAYGFRNPWRFSFDRLTGDLIAADVGENSFEEIDIVRKGGNYGWNTLEGSSCYNAATCSRVNTVLPISEYPHAEGLAVIGGYRYRGSANPALAGRYFFSDYVSGHVWTLERAADDTWLRSRAADVGFYTSAFGEDESGELYLLSFFGEVFRIDYAN